jgi:SAM-dependent methyltransferase
VSQSSTALLAERQIELESPLERVLRERTDLLSAPRQVPDLLSAPRRVLHIAPAVRLRATLAELEQLDYCAAEPTSGSLDSLELPFVEESFDVVICDGAEDGRRVPLREIARMLRPGGRAILTAPNGESEETFAELLARAGFFATRVRERIAPTVFICVRGEL